MTAATLSTTFENMNMTDENARPSRRWSRFTCALTARRRFAFENRLVEAGDVFEAEFCEIAYWLVQAGLADVCDLPVDEPAECPRPSSKSKLQ